VCVIQGMTRYATRSWRQSWSLRSSADFAAHSRTFDRSSWKCSTQASAAVCTTDSCTSSALRTGSPWPDTSGSNSASRCVVRRISCFLDFKFYVPLCKDDGSRCQRVAWVGVCVLQLFMYCLLTHTHTHARTHTHTPLMALCPGLPGSAGTRKVKPMWILLKQETMSGGGISLAICKYASRSRQITTPAPHHSVFTGRMPFLPPNQQHQSTEDKVCLLTHC